MNGVNLIFWCKYIKSFFWRVTTSWTYSMKLICIGASKMSELVDRELDWQAWIHATALPATPLHTRIFNNRLVIFFFHKQFSISMSRIDNLNGILSLKNQCETFVFSLKELIYLTQYCRRRTVQRQKCLSTVSIYLTKGFYINIDIKRHVQTSSCLCLKLDYKV